MGRCGPASAECRANDLNAAVSGTRSNRFCRMAALVPTLRSRHAHAEGAAGMPNLLTAIDDRIEVEYGQFLLQEDSMTRSPLELPVPGGDWLAAGGPGGLLLHSAGTANRLEKP